MMTSEIILLVSVIFFGLESVQCGFHVYTDVSNREKNELCTTRNFDDDDYCYVKEWSAKIWADWCICVVPSTFHNMKWSVSPFRSMKPAWRNYSTSNNPGDLTLLDVKWTGMLRTGTDVLNGPFLKQVVQSSSWDHEHYSDLPYANDYEWLNFTKHFTYDRSQIYGLDKGVDMGCRYFHFEPCLDDNDLLRSCSPRGHHGRYLFQMLKNFKYVVRTHPLDVFILHFQLKHRSGKTKAMSRLLAASISETFGDFLLRSTDSTWPPKISTMIDLNRRILVIFEDFPEQFIKKHDFIFDGSKVIAPIPQRPVSKRFMREHRNVKWCDTARKKLCILQVEVDKQLRMEKQSGGFLHDETKRAIDPLYVLKMLDHFKGSVKFNRLNVLLLPWIDNNIVEYRWAMDKRHPFDAIEDFPITMDEIMKFPSSEITTEARYVDTYKMMAVESA